ncbi:P-loop containing nucleoside triphosphate hydrolase protein [Phaeosphaeriaceae sp. PMI808]|nr:P-loop containing nucleoside triphosphate hydrolase protein [Phaeosphaeriaceae sp. PMI808]
MTDLPTPTPSPPSSNLPSPNPSPPPAKLIAFLGGPGSGKGTQSKLLAEGFDSTHLSIGDLLRAEAQDNNSPYFRILQENLAAGRLGDKEMTVGILQTHVDRAIERGTGMIVLDGFPRKPDTAAYFEEQGGKIDLVVVLDCSEDVLVGRLALRMREDDGSVDNVRQRIETWNTDTAEVIARYAVVGKVVWVRADRSVEEVQMDVQRALMDKGVIARVDS